MRKCLLLTFALQFIVTYIIEIALSHLSTVKMSNKYIVMYISRNLLILRLSLITIRLVSTVKEHLNEICCLIAHENKFTVWPDLRKVDTFISVA